MINKKEVIHKKLIKEIGEDIYMKILKILKIIIYY